MVVFVCITIQLLFPGKGSLAPIAVCLFVYLHGCFRSLNLYHLLIWLLFFFLSVLEQSGQQLQPNLAAVRARCQMLKYIFFLQWHHGLWLVLCMDSLPATWLCSVLTACGCRTACRVISKSYCYVADYVAFSPQMASFSGTDLAV